MNPKKFKELIPLVSEKTGEPEVLIQDLSDFYWKKVRQLINEKQELKIKVRGLGDFKVREYKLDKIITQTHEIMGHLDRSSFKNFPKIKFYEEKLEKLDLLKQKIEDLKLQKTQYRKEHYGTDYKNHQELLVHYGRIPKQDIQES